MADFVVIRRNELYQQVWTGSITRLAKKYGISDVGLKKICKRMDVPTPPRGYWARVQNGQRVGRAKLTRLKSGGESTYELRLRRNAQDAKTPEVGEVAQKLIDKIKADADFVVPDEILKAHPLVARARRVLKKGDADRQGIVDVWTASYLDIRVSSDSLSRAFNFMDTLIKTLWRYRVRVIVEKGKTLVKVPGFDGPVPIYLREKVNQHPHQMTKEERDEEKRFGHSFAPKFDYEPAGALCFYINTDYGIRCRKRWMDGKTQKLEEMLGSIVGGIVIAADRLRIARIENEERARRREAERLRQAERERLWRIEKSKREALVEQAKRWAQSVQIRDFIQAVRVKAMDESGNWGRTTLSNENQYKISKIDPVFLP